MAGATAAALKAMTTIATRHSSNVSPADEESGTLPIQFSGFESEVWHRNNLLRHLGAVSVGIIQNGLTIFIFGATQ
jgi:hypothetical protein